MPQYYDLFQHSPQGDKGADTIVPPSGYVYPGNFNNETIDYLTRASRNGAASPSGEDTLYHFADFNTGSGSQLSSRYSELSPLNGIPGALVAIGKKTRRNGVDAHWLKRANLLASSVPMVVDDGEQSWDYELSEPQGNDNVMAAEAVELDDGRTCVTDDFSSLDAELDNWAPLGLLDSIQPYAVGGRMRMTEDLKVQSTVVTFLRRFPAADNLIEVEFDLFAYSDKSSSFERGDGLAMVFSDAAIAPSPGGYGGSLGYSLSTWEPGFAGGWLGIGFDEYGFFSNPWEGRIGGIDEHRPNVVAVRGSEASKYRYLQGTDTLSPPVGVVKTSVPGPGHRYRIVLDTRVAGKAMFSVERDVKDGLGFSPAIAPFNALSFDGQEAMPEKMILSFSSSTGVAINRHEIDNVKVCARGIENISDSLHHFEFSYSSSPATCQPEVITIRACQDEACSQLVTDPVTAELSVSDPSAAHWVGGNFITINNGVAQVPLQGKNSSPITIGTFISLPAPSSPALCSRGGAAPTAAQCSFSFFTDSALSIDVPDKLAGQPVMATVSACQAFASTSKVVDFWSSYNSPAAPVPAGAEPQIALLGNNIGTTQSRATPITLAFDAQAQAQVALDYPDAGAVTLNARYTGSAGGDDEGLVMNGSGRFVSAPVGLCVSAQSSCSAADGRCPVFKRAGENFPLSISGRAWVANDDGDLCNNPVTPNYAHHGIQLGAELVAPSGGVNGVTGLTSYTHNISATGISQLDQSISEVGVFRFTATPPANYLGSSNSLADIPAAISEPVGRFVAADFLLSSENLTAACGSGSSSFSYLGQPFATSFIATARNLQQQPTRNFVSATSPAANFANTSVRWAAENNNNGTDLASRLTEAPSLYWVDGVATVVNHQVSMQRPTPPQVDGPYYAMDIGVIIDDGDSLAVMGNADMNAGTTGNCSGSNCSAVRLGSQQLLFGRLTMNNVYGVESDTLQMPLRAEYWQWNHWQINHKDSCTSVGTGSGNVNPALLSAVDDGNGYRYTPDLLTGQSVSRQGSGALVQGQFDLLWQSDGTVPYRGSVQAPLASPDWLKYYWDWDGSSPGVNADPRASAAFGVRRGHDKRVSWREK
ncbi:MAG: MSHA biogenesis protein MshQ [Shewanella sp.]|nr:MSHA biogenesis protein MshQ [Shewanella sp.]